jgi:glycosyltransferase involved in cell wall biosynthesis
MPDTDKARRRIVVDANPAVRPVATGTEVYTREVCSRLAGVAPDLDWTFLASRPATGAGFDVTVAPFTRMWSQIRLPVAATALRASLLFVPAHSIPFAWTGRTLTVVHDLAFERHPDAYATRERGLLRATTRWAVARCRIVVAVSEATKADLVACYGVAPERVRVVPNGGGEPPVLEPARTSRLAELGVTGEYVLQVGRVEARKNQDAAIAAVERLEGVTLVVAGPERDQEISGRLRASPRCRVVGRVDGQTLERLYKSAGAVVVPSLYEGFGLPVVEAMARGKVVVAARNSSLPEVGGEVAVYVDDPNDAGALAAALDRALHDRPLRTALARKGRVRAARFTWDRCARGLADAVREALA